MRILVACEYSGVVREDSKHWGLMAWSCGYFAYGNTGQALECSRGSIGSSMDLIDSASSVSILV